MNTEQIQGMRQQLTGLLFQISGAIIRNETYVLRGRSLRMSGYLRTRLAKALRSGQRRMRQLRLSAVAQPQRHG